MPPVGPGQVADHERSAAAVCSTMLGDNGGTAAQSQRRHIARREPASSPDGLVGIALLKLHPDARADRRHHVDPHRGAGRAGQRRACLAPARRHQSEHVRNDAHDPSAQLGIDILHHGAAVLAVKPFRLAGFAHTGTFGVVRDQPVAAELEALLVFTALDVMRDAVDVIETS